MSTPFNPRENPTTNMINLEDVAETSRLIEIDHLSNCYDDVPTHASLLAKKGNNLGRGVRSRL